MANQAYKYILILTQVYSENMQLEKYYAGKTKGRAYLSRKVLIDNKKRYTEEKLRKLGTEYSIVEVHYCRKGKYYKVLLTGVNIDEAKAIIKLREPQCYDIETREIQVGNPVTVK